MQVFKAYFKILKKQMVAILIYAGLFLGITIMVNMNQTKVDKEEFSIKKVPIMVVNEDGQNDFIDSFLKHMENYVTLVETEEDIEARQDALFYRKVRYIMTIPKGFTEAFLAGDEIALTKQTIPDSIESVSVDNTVNNYLNMAKVYLKHEPELNYDQLNIYIEKNLQEETEVAFSVVQEDAVENSNRFNVNYYNYLAYIIIAGFISAVSIIMFYFNGIDVRRKHSASPLTAKNMNFQLIFANFVFVMMYLIVFIVAGSFLNPGHRMNGNTILFWINAFTFSLTALSISYLIGITVKSKKAVSAIATAVSLSLAFISGVFVPQEYLGASVLKLASFTPAYWYVKANNTIANLVNISGTELAETLGYMAIQLGFAAAIISIALVVSKRKRQQAF